MESIDSSLIEKLRIRINVEKNRVYIKTNNTGLENEGFKDKNT